MNRTLCAVLKEMRKCEETKNFSYLAGLIEEAQSMGNRMEAALEDKSDLEHSRNKLSKMKKLFLEKTGIRFSNYSKTTEELVDACIEENIDLLKAIDEVQGEDVIERPFINRLHSSIEELREEFYDFLVEKDCLTEFLLNWDEDITPDVEDYVKISFIWGDSDSGFDYWNDIDDKWREYVQLIKK